jgi:hypothetical protein
VSSKAQRKRKRKGMRGRRTIDDPSGFDFGLPPIAMAVGSNDFVRDLSSASIIAVAYGKRWSSKLSSMIPSIALVGRNAEALGSAFDVFNNWEDLTGSDSLQLTLVLRKAGGYVICIAPEIARLERRCIGYHRNCQPLAMTATWLKSMDSTQPALHELRDYCSQLIAPMFLDGMSCESDQDALNGKLQSISGLRPLLKFDVAFVDEDDVAPSSMGWLALHLEDATETKPSVKQQKPSPSEIELQRIRSLRTHFPVTLERMRVSQHFKTIVSELSTEGIRAWQVEQAFCNFIMTNRKQASRSRSSTARDDIADLLDALYEIADGTTLPILSAEQVRAQIRADGNFLLLGVRGKTAVDTVKLIAALRAARLLDARPAVVSEHT